MPAPPLLLHSRLPGLCLTAESQNRIEMERPENGKVCEPASPIPAADLTEESILSIFGLTRDVRDEIWTLAKGELCDVPAHLGMQTMLATRED